MIRYDYDKLALFRNPCNVMSPQGSIYSITFFVVNTEPIRAMLVSADLYTFLLRCGMTPRSQIFPFNSSSSSSHFSRPSDSHFNTRTVPSAAKRAVCRVCRIPSVTVQYTAVVRSPIVTVHRGHGAAPLAPGQLRNLNNSPGEGMSPEQDSERVCTPG
jgi:hypothetical protein